MAGRILDLWSYVSRSSNESKRMSSHSDSNVNQFSRKLFSSKRRGASDTSLHPDRGGSAAGRTGRHFSVDSDVTAVDSEAIADELRTTRSTSPQPNYVLPVRTSTPTPDRANDPQGLTLLHAPTGPPAADIVFIHGLGGSSRLTWCMNRDTDLFWPERWLPMDRKVQHARIFTFGYNADFRSSAQSASIGIADFAKVLLYDMCYGRSLDGTEFNFGQSPIIFVAHSMGGLVFKKAYLDGQLDARYSSIVQAIHAVIFLSTPHRGSDLSQLLNKILAISFKSSSKQYVAELKEQGPFLRTINEQFRHIATRLQIFSFYETLQTPMGFSSTMVLDPESAQLGYPGEVSRSMNADHHNVCKFDSPQNPNYKAVLDALKSLVPVDTPVDPDAEDDLCILQGYLSIQDTTEDDTDLFWSRRAENTCTWLLRIDEFSSWATASTSSKVLWIHGRPARGKSVMSSFVVNHLREQRDPVQCFFFRSGDDSKQSVGSLLRSMAFQVARRVPLFRRSLIKLIEDGYKIRDSDWKSTWKRIFVGLAFQKNCVPPVHWVFDGLDESSNQQRVLELLGEINASTVPIHVLVTSRWSPSLSSSFDKIGTTRPISTLCIDRHVDDIRTYTGAQLDYLGWNSSIIDDITDQIVERSNDNFLWVHLVLEEVKECHTEHAIRERISEIPTGMDSLYKRMEDAIANIKRLSDRMLSRAMFLWAMYTRRPLSLEELSDILQPEFGRLLNISHTVNTLCGHFVVIEGSNQVGLIHQTAREYLITTATLPFSLESGLAHGDMFRTSLATLMEKSLRSKLHTVPLSTLEYRATSWSFHLESAKDSSRSDEHLDLLMEFFTQPGVLTWIYILASLSQLRVLVEVSQYLHAFVKRKRRSEAAREPAHRRFQELEMLESWSRDLLKITGKFGSILSRDPASIYYCIIPFCPTSSAIYKSFSQLLNTSLSVKGLSEEWDDCLARVSVDNGHLASLISCSGRYLSVVDSMGTTTIWDCTTFHQIRILDHGEPVSSVCFSEKGDRVATYGSNTTKIWAPRSGELLQSIPNLADNRALCLGFVDEDEAIVMGSDRRCVLKASLGTENPLWDYVNSSILDDNDMIEGTYLNSPISLSLSPDGSKMAAAYRRFPMTIWALDPPRIVRRVARAPRPEAPSEPGPFVSRMSWHPDGEEILGIFMDSYIFKLNTADGSNEEIAPGQGGVPSDIVCSPEGSVYATSSVHGTVKIYDYKTSTLIYQLSSEDMITALCFSHDGRQFYDIRGSYCNIWEPNTLLRLSENDDAAHSQGPSESVDQSNVASESNVDNSVPVTHVTPMPGRPVVCTGDDEGLLSLFDWKTDQKTRVGQTATNMAVEHLVWGDDGNRFCYAELSGRITIVQVEYTPTGWTHKRLGRFKPNMDEGGIKQLLFLSGSKLLLIAFSTSSQLWTLDPPTLHASYTPDPSTPLRRWAMHPSSGDHVLGVTPTSINIYEQQTLNLISQWSWIDPRAGLVAMHSDSHLLVPTLQNKDPDTTSILSTQYAVEEQIEDTIVTFSKSHILVKILRHTPTRKLRPRFVVFNAAALDVKNTSNFGRLTPLAMPSEVTSQVEMPLNILKNERLIYIDRELGVCSWRLGQGSDTIKRHFFIPRDWLSSQNLAMLHVTGTGDILCPRNGRVAVVESMVGSAW